MVLRHALTIAGICLSLAPSGCAGVIEEPPETFEDRADLNVLYMSTSIRSGVSDEIEFEVPPDTVSMLIEVHGSTGYYYLSKFQIPSGRDLIPAGQFITRGASELPGMVSWLYPNRPEATPTPGTYNLVIRAESRDSGRVDDEDVEVRVYLKQDSDKTGCSLRLDFLVADDAIVAEDALPLVEGLVSRLRQRYAAAGVEILDDFTASSLDLITADIEVEGNASDVISIVDDALYKARVRGQARSQALHLLLVRSLGGELRGYSMGLPGPMASVLPTSGVLVATREFSSSGLVDVDQMSETVAHEVGHYLGLYHTSETDRMFHDPIDDTLECTAAGCPDEFWLNLMTPGTIDREQLSAGQAAILRRHPLCIPNGQALPDGPVGPIDPSTCDMPCEAPYTCGQVQGSQFCALACDPAQGCSNGASCEADDLGKYICAGP